jgi:hypothetical protein
MKRPYKNHTVEQMLDELEVVVKQNILTRLDATSHGGSYFDKAHETAKEAELTREAVQLELLYRIDHKLDRLGSELRSAETV